MPLRWLAIATALPLGAIAPAHAADIDGSCMVTFNVKNKSFLSAGQSISCVAFEKRRVDLFLRLDAVPKTGTVSADPVAVELEALEAKIKSIAESKSWSSFGLAISGNTLGTLGFTSCLETAGIGCAVAVISKVSGMLSLLDTAVSDAQKAKDMAELQSHVAKLRAAVKGKSAPAPPVHDRLVQEANALCTTVKSNCL